MTQTPPKEIKVKLYLDYIQTQTGLEPTEIAEEMATALESVILKNRHYPKDAKIQVQIDPNSGLLEIFREWLVVDTNASIENEEYELPLSTAAQMSDEIQVGQILLEALPADQLGRIAAQQAKHLFSKIIREGQLGKKRKHYEKEIGNVVTGVVKLVKRDYLLVDMPDQATAVIYRKHIIPREIFREGDKITAVITSNNSEYRNAVVELSRTHSDFLKKLFLSEVPEIHEGSIEIMAVARDPGLRAKVAVKSNDKRVDPIGSCIGMRGTRVQAVSNELNGERIDIILWDKDPAKMVIQSLAPGKIESIEVDEETTTMELNVTNDNLAQTIGKSGQNIKLASELTGWTLNISKQSLSDGQIIEQLCESLDIDDEIAKILVQHQITSAQAIIRKGSEALAEDIPEFDQDIAEAMIERAQSALLEETLTVSEMEGELPLLRHSAINLQYAKILQEKGINNDDDLGDLSTDELIEILPLDRQAASELIMEARKHWFDNSEGTSTS